MFAQNSTFMRYKKPFAVLAIVVCVSFAAVMLLESDSATQPDPPAVITAPVHLVGIPEAVVSLENQRDQLLMQVNRIQGQIDMLKSIYNPPPAALDTTKKEKGK